jgi:hypothetical protein
MPSPFGLLFRAQNIRAIDRARAALKPGDRIAFTSCPGTARTATFTGWSGNWACSKSRDDISPRCIFRLNGAPISFTDPPWEEFDPNTGRAHGDHGTSTQALEWALDVYSDPGEAIDFLREWRTGGAWEEWPEFYEWLEPYPAERARRADGRLAAADLRRGDDGPAL